MWLPTSRPPNLTRWIQELDACGLHEDTLALLALTDWELLYPLPMLDIIAQEWALAFRDIQEVIERTLSAFTEFWKTLGTIEPSLLEIGDQDA